MAVSANTPFVLKILSGPHQGAEVLLPLGQTTVGSSLDCDVILSDAMLAPLHFRLKVAAEGAEVIADAPDLFCQGKRVPVGQGASLGNFEFITVGTTQMIIGPSEGEWPNLTAADAPALFTDSLESVTADELEDAEGVAESDEGGNNEGQFTGFGDRMTQEPTGFRGRFAWFFKLEPRLRWAVGGGGALVFGLILWIIFASSSFSLENAMDQRDLAETRSEVQGILDKLNIPAQLACEISGNYIIVYGYVKTQDQRVRLMKALEGLGPGVLIKIYSEDSLALEAQELMQQYGMLVTIKADSPGKIQVNGYSADTAAWERARGALLSDIPGVQTIDDHVITGQQVQAQAVRILGQLDLANRVLITPQPQQVVAMGIVPPSMTQLWQQAREQLTQFLNDTVPLKDQVRVSDSTATTQNYFDNQLEMISVDSPRWISLQNGQKYFIGATLPSGYMIMDISDDGITLQRGSEQVKINLRSI
ncbi:MAG TPA: type III secretion system inner membrane ring subunit SctD [Opitutales bacterium]|nr:type III secretion system inner membrane ring subunit SctD [Opitutales bacterium]